MDTYRSSSCPSQTQSNTAARNYHGESLNLAALHQLIVRAVRLVAFHADGT
jgi:hypothetical protein